MTDSILFWNQVALDACKTDFSSATPADDPTPQQPGPTYSSRALAIIHLAMYDSYAAVTGAGTYLSYTAPGPGTAALAAAQAAVGAAACLTLTAMFSRQKETFLKKHAEFLATLGATDPDVELGLAWGKRVANQMLDSRKNDGSDASNDQYAPSAMPYRHRPDPLNPTQGFLGPLWGKVAPFGINNLNTAVTALLPHPTGSAYTLHFNQVKLKGQEQGSTRTPAETTTGLFWAYDGARNIGLPPRLYNQVIRAIAAKAGSTETQNAKLFAMVNAGMADAGIQAWHEKYKHNLWRPVVGIRESDAGWGPSGIGDSNVSTTGDPYWKPLGAPRTNRSGAPSVTPGFPAYPSGHATFGTVALRLAEKALALPGSFKFDFVSDELNGENVGAAGIRPVHKRTMSIADAIEDNIASRVFLGVHWRFDGDTGKLIGEEIATKIAAAFPAKA